MATDLFDRLGGARSSLAFKAPCRVATTANITLSGEQTIDGVSVLEEGANGEPDRVLVKDQDTATENGIYAVSTGAWSRTKDFDGNEDVVHGTRVFVHSGSIGSGEYIVTTADPIVIDTSSIAFDNVPNGLLLKEISEPSAPSENTSRLYVRDVNGITTLFYKDSADRERVLNDFRYDVREYGALGDGSTDDSTAINAAITAAHGADGGIVHLPAGDYLISSPIVPRSFCPIVGDGLQNTRILVGTGSTAYAQASASQLNSAGIRGVTFVAQSGSEGATAISLTAAQNNEFDYLGFENFSSGIILDIESVTTTTFDISGYEHGSNTVFNKFTNWYGYDIGTCIHLLGHYGSTPTGSPANSSNVPDIVITHNRYENLNFWLVHTKGIDAEGAADTEGFKNVFIELDTNNAIAVDLASHATFTGNNYCNSFDFDNLIVSLNGSPTGVTLIQFGWTFANTFKIKHDLDPSAVTTISDVNSQSHDILCQRFVGSTNTLLERITKGTTLLHSSGTEALPSYTFFGDNNTGIYRAGADVLGFAANGGGRVLVSESGLIIVAGQNLIFQDTDQSHSLVCTFGTDLSANRTFTFTSGDANLTRDLRDIGRLSPGYVSILVSQAADTDHDVTFAAGRARDDSDAENIVLSSAITKQIDAAWSVGTNQGGLDTGTVANTTIYYLWIIMRSDTGVVDALFSTSATSPTMPTNYDYKQRVGWVRTDSSANILAFQQLINDQDDFRYVTPILDVAVTNITTSRTSLTLSVPPNATAAFKATAGDANSAEAINISFTSLFETDTAPTLTNGLISLGTAGAAYYGNNVVSGEFYKQTNSSAQIGARAAEDTDNALYIATLGAKFRRGILP